MLHTDATCILTLIVSIVARAGVYAFRSLHFQIDDDLRVSPVHQIWDSFLLKLDISFWVISRYYNGVRCCTAILNDQVLGPNIIVVLLMRPLAGAADAICYIVIDILFVRVVLWSILLGWAI